MKTSTRAASVAASLAVLLWGTVLPAAARSEITNQPKARKFSLGSKVSVGYATFVDKAAKGNSGLAIALIILAVLAVAAIVTAILLVRSRKVQYLIRCDSGPLKGQIFPLREGTVTIGRNPDSSICFPNETKGVSRAHCTVSCKKGVLTIQDQKSNSGTFIVKKGQVPSDKPTSIRVGQSFYLGQQENMFTIIHK